MAAVDGVATFSEAARCILDILKATQVFHILPDVRNTASSSVDHDIRPAIGTAFKTCPGVFAHLPSGRFPNGHPRAGPVDMQDPNIFFEEVELAVGQLNTYTKKIGRKAALVKCRDRLLPKLFAIKKGFYGLPAYVRSATYEPRISYDNLLRWMCFVADNLRICSMLSSSTMPEWRAVISLVYIMLNMLRTAGLIRSRFSPSINVPQPAYNPHADLPVQPDVAEEARLHCRLIFKETADMYFHPSRYIAARAKIVGPAQNQLNRAVVDLLLARRNALSLKVFLPLDVLQGAMVNQLHIAEGKA